MYILQKNLTVAPRIEVNRKKIKWSDDGIGDYLSLFNRYSADVCKLWYNPSSPALSRLFLQVSNSMCDMAATRSNNNAKSKSRKCKSSVIPSSIRRVKNQLRKYHSMLKAARCNPLSTPEMLLFANQKFSAAKKAYRKVVRQDRATRSVKRDLHLNNFEDVYKYVRSCKNVSLSKLRELTVGDKKYTDDMVPDGFFDAMSSVKTCDMNEVLKEPPLFNAVRDSEHIVQLCKVGQQLPPVSIERSFDLLTKLKKDVTDVYGMSSLHYLHAGDDGLRQFALMMNTILLNTDNASILEVNTTHGLIIYKGGQKEKTSERSYRTISTCPIVEKLWICI